MKDHTNSAEDTARPEHSAAHCVDFCLRKLDADRRHSLSDFVVKGLTFEELIGALLAAQDVIQASAEAEELSEDQP